MNLFPKLNIQISSPKPPRELFEILSAQIQEKSNWLLTRYTSPFYGSTQFPNALFRLSKGTNGWYWVNASISSSSENTTVSFEISPKPFARAILMIGTIVLLTLATGFIINISSLKEAIAPIGPIFMLLFIWQSFRLDFRLTESAVGTLVAALKQDSPCPGA